MRLRFLPLATVLLVVLTSCAVDEPSPTATYGGDDLRPERLAPSLRESIRAARHDEPIFVLGDSLARGARDAGMLEAKLTEAGWLTEVLAETSRGIPWAMGRLAYRHDVPGTVVLVLGTNPSPTVGAFPEQVDELLARLTELGAERFLWVPPVHRDPARYRERQIVLEQAASDERILLTDWPAVTAEHPEWFSGDGIHLTVAGYDALATSIADWLDVLTR